jgi:hypothetical protein
MLTINQQLASLLVSAPDGYATLVHAAIYANDNAKRTAALGLIDKIESDGDSDTVWHERIDEIANEILSQ